MVEEEVLNPKLFGGRDCRRERDKRSGVIKGK